MSNCAFTIFETPIGRCALLWRSGFVVGAALPESSDARLLTSLARRFGAPVEEDPPQDICNAVDGVKRLLSGEDVDFSDVAIDIGSLGKFERAVLVAARRIPRGETRTYGEIAVSVGAPGAARAVGTALGRNPIPIIVPCHRVLAAGGASGGFSAPGGLTTKLKILEIERARRGPEPGLFDHLPWAARTNPSQQS